jgi:hypothetical protein
MDEYELMAREVRPIRACGLHKAFPPGYLHHLGQSDFTGTNPFGFGDTSGCDAVRGGSHVVTLVISKSVRRARTSDDAVNHYSMRNESDVCFHANLTFSFEIKALPYPQPLCLINGWR